MNNKTIYLPLLFVPIELQKMNRESLTNVNLADEHLANIYRIDCIQNDAMNCNDFHIHKLFQMFYYNLVCCNELYFYQ